MDRVLHPTEDPPQNFEGIIHTVLEDSSPAKPYLAEGLPGASRALFCVHLKKHFSGPVVVVTPDQLTAETLLEDIRFFCQHEKLKVLPKLFPTWEQLPFEPLSPMSEISGERLEVLNSLSEGECGLLIVPLEALLQTLMPQSILKKLTFHLKKGQTADREFLEICLMDNGYSKVSLVEERGEFSLRGDILDIFLPSGTNPVRIEFFGDDIESIRQFDLDSQVSTEEVEEIHILPVREICLSQAEMEQGIERIKKTAELQETDSSHVNELIEKIQCVGNFAGIENLAPFFYPEKCSLFNYLPGDSRIVLDHPELIDAKSEDFHHLIQVEFDRALERNDVVPDPSQSFLDEGELKKLLEGYSQIHINSLRLSDSVDNSCVQFSIQPIPYLHGKFEAFAQQTNQWKSEGNQVVVVAPAKGHAKRVRELLNEYDLYVEIELGHLSTGFQIPSLNRVYVAEHEIFGRSHKRRHRRKPKSFSFQRGFKDLKPGDFLVHIDYGIGQYVGTRELKTGVGGGEFMEILYADDEKLYIPMDALSLIQKYQGSDEGRPPISKLGSVSWKRQKDKIKKSIREMAEGLLKLYASRQFAERPACSSQPVLIQEFADSFEYTETDDQLKAIEEVFEDQEKSKPMDRLVCGDVGYGKTEVAMRAAYKVVLEKKQVAVLVPTTILAQQHLLTFQERFRAYPVNIDMVNRFRTPKQQKETLKKLKNHEVDIIIGTHRLLSKDIEFADLGLVIIDEEQRFGVKHKERMKQLRTTVDILTLTATPIPRTLHFSLMGIRDLSVIETPPSDRLAVKTFVRKFDENVIREAILRELDRGGQIYFVHNKVHSIESVATMIQKIVPEVKIGIAHGQLAEHRLEKVMKQFIDKEIDLLLCTSIIESGLDIPSANTIIIHRADQFGLAQLYQLRGRVGRYKHQAYAYLMIPGAMIISEDARKRLTAIEEMSELGSGFQLAARDMEIRGTGNMLGHDQSGHINAIGFDLYCKLMEDTIKELRGKKTKSKIEPEIDLQVKGYIPKSYIPDLNQRLEFYRRLQLVNEVQYVRSMLAEMEDRYGTPPEPVEKLFSMLRIKLLCQKLHILKAHLKRDVVYLYFDPSTPVSTERLLTHLGKKFQLGSEYQVQIILDGRGWRKDMNSLQGYLEMLTDPEAEDDSDHEE